MVHAPSRPPAGAPPVRVNLYSDTQTRPTAPMKQAMLAAEVGDEQAAPPPHPALSPSRRGRGKLMWQPISN